MSTEIDLDGIESLIDEATEAPFEIDGCDQCGVWGRGGSQFVGDLITSQDARLLVAARNQLPALVAEVRLLRAKVAAGERLAEAAEPIARQGGVPQDGDSCHVGITTKEKCGRCSRQQALIESLADWREAGKDGTK